MISTRELREKNIEYSDTYWKWEAPHYVVETREFSEDDNMQYLRFDEYCELQAEKLNEEHSTHLYTVACSMYKDRISTVTVVKLKEREQ